MALSRPVGPLRLVGHMEGPPWALALQDTVRKPKEKQISILGQRKLLEPLWAALSRSRRLPWAIFRLSRILDSASAQDRLGSSAPQLRAELMATLHPTGHLTSSTVVTRYLSSLDFHGIYPLFSYCVVPQSFYSRLRLAFFTLTLILHILTMCSYIVP